MQIVRYALQTEHLQQFFHGETVERRNSFEDADEGTGLDGLMSGNHFVVLSAALRGYANMRSFLTGNLIAEDFQRSG